MSLLKVSRFASSILKLQQVRNLSRFVNFSNLPDDNVFEYNLHVLVFLSL